MGSNASTQRARRYRAAKNAAEAAAAEAKNRRVDALGSCDGGGSSFKRESAEVRKGFDSNCISPGTEFMAAFFRHLRFFCEKKLNEDPRWRGLKVLLSGPDVPGNCSLFALCGKLACNAG